MGSGGRPVLPVPAGPIAERVRGYWSAGQPERAGRRQGDSPAPREARTLPADRDRPSREGGNGRAEPLPDSEIARSLGAFTGGQPLPAPTARSRPLANPALEATNGWQRPAGSAASPDRPMPQRRLADGELRARALPRPGMEGGGPSRAAALRDLAEDVAEILREQALRHGIDVP